MAGGNYVTGLEGILKLVTIIFGIISLGCGAPAYNKEHKFEEFFFSAVILCLLASVILYPIFLMAASLDGNRGIRFLDFFYHIILGLILVVASSMMLSSGVKHHKNEDPVGWQDKDTKDFKHFDKKIAAGSIGIINGIIYFVAGVLVISKRNDDEMNFSRNYPKGA